MSERKLAPIGAARLNLVLAQERIRTDLEQQNQTIARQTGNDVEPPPHRISVCDPWLLRGIPVVGAQGGIGGAVAGSRPDTVGSEP